MLARRRWRWLRPICRRWGCCSAALRFGHAAILVPLADTGQGIAAGSAGDDRILLELLLERAELIGHDLLGRERCRFGRADEARRRRVAGDRSRGRVVAG